MHLKMSSAKWRPFCLDLNVLKLKMLVKEATGDKPVHETMMIEFTDKYVTWRLT